MVRSLALDVYIRFPSLRFPPGKLVCVTQYTGCGEKYPSEIFWQKRVRIFFKRNFTRLHVQRGWWRGSVVERRSLAGELSLSCARPAADG